MRAQANRVRWAAALAFESQAPAELLFDLLSDAPSWPGWFGPVRRAEWLPARPTSDGLRIRRVTIGPVRVLEAIIEEARPTHHAYELLTVLPVRGHRADVWLRPHEVGTRIEWTMSFEPKIPGTGWLVGAGLVFGVSRLAAALIAEAERDCAGR